MCEYLQLAKNGNCRLTSKQCPYTYFCAKINNYKISSNFPKKCNVAEQAEIPEGYYKVCFEKRGNLYINYKGHIEIVKNPFDETPAFVKMFKNKNGTWRIRK